MNIVINSKTHGAHTLIFDKEDYQKIKGITWCLKVYRKNKYAVGRCKIRGKVVSFHKQILKTNKVIDHINGNGLDNRRVNLRECTHRENIRNQVNRKTKGVYLRKDTGKWQAQIMVDYKHISLGCYTTKKEAVEAYKVGKIKHHKEFTGVSYQLYS